MGRVNLAFIRFIFEIALITFLLDPNIQKMSKQLIYHFHHYTELMRLTFGTVEIAFASLYRLQKDEGITQKGFNPALCMASFILVAYCVPLINQGFLEALPTPKKPL